MNALEPWIPHTRCSFIHNERKAQFNLSGREREGAMEIANTRLGPYRREDVEQVLLEGQKTKRKLQKVQQRRDHYARLYYQALMELDMTKLELSRAHQEISELKGQVTRQLQCGSNGKLGVGSNTTSPDSGASVSPGQGVDGAAVFPRQQPLVPGPGPRANPRTLTHTIHTSDASWAHTQEDVPLRAPMGCSAPPAFAHPQFRRSLSLSQQESAFAPHLLVAGTKSYRTHKPLRATTSLQHPPPAESAGVLMTLQHPSPTESAAASVSAFKQFSSPDRSCLSQPVPPPPMHADIQPSNLVCDRQQVKFDSLSSNDLLTVYCQLSALTCPVLKLELSNCHLGQAQNMKLFCKYLVKNRSLVELSLPHNGISLDSLSLLLDSIQQCPNVKELLLRNNRIGHECASKIKEFLAGATLDSLVLTGNEIENYSHLLDGSLPSDFAMEYGPRRDTCSVESADSGLPLADPTDTPDTTDAAQHNSPHSLPMHSAFKYLRI